MITCVVGTNKPGDNSVFVSATVKSIYGELEVPFEVLDLALLPPEIFSPRSYLGSPPTLGTWMARLRNSTGVIVIAPEYCGGMPGVLKYLFDVVAAHAVLKSKPVCLIGLSADATGGAKSVQQLHHVCSSQLASVFLGTVCLPWINARPDYSGMSSEPETRARLRHQAMAFVEFCRQVNSPVLHTGGAAAVVGAEAID